LPNSDPRTRQHTLARPVTAHGHGIHGGRPATLTLHPAAVGSGIVFERSDLPAGRNCIPARWHRVVETRLCTVIANGRGATVSTLEHLMAALRALGVDNARIELDGPEVPILDGSAAQWLALLDEAGLATQPAARRSIRVLHPVRITDGDKWAMLLPDDAARFCIDIDFSEPVIGRQHYELSLDAASFRSQIAAARTFGFVRDIDALRAQGLARGGSFDNAVVIGTDGVLNPGGLRFADEFVRHKLLDCIGDLYLAGAPILGLVVASRPGHALNVALLRALFAQRSAWQPEYGSPAPFAIPRRLAA
jgi:UDP-3-O-[3-hydroxymyristoyl] N-acetylglucosamine deacetylase